MPWALKGRCNREGCREAQAVRGLCAKHHAEEAEKKRQSDRERIERYKRERVKYDEEYKERSAFYKTAAWRKLRKMQLASEPLCRSCGNPARVVDHIIQIARGGEWFEMGNLQSLCDRCHNIKSSRESRMIKYRSAVTLVIGPPFSGKTTFVRERARDNDLIVDLDAIMLALSNGRTGPHDVNPALLPFACEARDAIIQRLYRDSEARHAWIISTSIKDAEIKAHQRAGGKVVLLVPPLIELRARVQNVVRQGKRSGDRDWVALVERWFYERRDSVIPQVRDAVERYGSTDLIAGLSIGEDEDELGEVD